MAGVACSRNIPFANSYLWASRGTILFANSCVNTCCPGSGAIRIFCVIDTWLGLTLTLRRPKLLLRVIEVRLFMINKHTGVQVGRLELVTQN